MSPKESQEGARAVSNVSRIFAERLRSGQFDDITVRELRVNAVQEIEQLLDGDAQASAVSVIVLIIWGDAPQISELAGE